MTGLHNLAQILLHGIGGGGSVPQGHGTFSYKKKLPQKLKMLTAIV